MACLILVVPTGRMSLDAFCPISRERTCVSVMNAVVSPGSQAYTPYMPEDWLS